MKFPTIIYLVLFVVVAFIPAFGKTPEGRVTPSVGVEDIFNLTDFGALGDGTTDDGPALQDALNAIAAAGGGTLFVPAGRYAIATPVEKDFSGLGASLTILGVESLTPVPPPSSPGDVLTKGLDLLSEFAPRTGTQGVAIQLKGLQSFLVKDITFIGQPDVNTDAVVTLALHDVWEATIRHCEFYGLSSLAQGGSIVLAVRSHLTLEQSVFLGSTSNSGYNSPVVQNIEWKGLTITDAVFADYGQRAELWGKLGLAAPYSWVNISNADALDGSSPRREVTIKNVFLDEGGLFGLSSTPNLPGSTPIDLFYISGLYMNVSNLASSGNYLNGPQRAMIVNSHYGWSHNADSAIDLRSVGNAILDKVECVENANRIRADAATAKLTIINSLYTYLDSQSPATRIITTEPPEEDPVQYVGQQFNTILGRDPDAAAHFYWSERLLQCNENVECVNAERAALSAYLSTAPVAVFSISGRITKESGAGLAGVNVTLTGSQSVITQTDQNGNYSFDKLPTSGVYTVTPSRINYTFNAPSQTITTPGSNQVRNFAAVLNTYSLSGQVTTGGVAVAGVTVSLSGSQSGTVTTEIDGKWSFSVKAEGSYTLTPSRTHYTFAPSQQTFGNLVATQTVDFSATLNRHLISGRVTKVDGSGFAEVGITISGAQTATTTSDSSGNYSFANLPAGGNYSITPAKANYEFLPASASFDDLSSDRTQNFSGTLVNYTLSGRVNTNGNGLAGVTITLSGSQSGSTITGSNGEYSFTVPAEGSYTLTPARTNNLFSPASANFNILSSNQSADFEATILPVLEFSATSYNVSESARRITVTVTRTGDTSKTAEVIYSADDGSAQQRNDVIPIVGRLSFLAGQTSKSFIVFITDDSYVEGDENLKLLLHDVVGGTLGDRSNAVLTILDNDSDATEPNPIDETQFFVRQQYRDFLNRPADDEGLAFWSNQILSCGTDTVCIADRRMNVSAAFFLSIEFQETGFLVYRLYRSSFGQAPQHINEFLLDTRTIGQGVIVNSPGWQELLEANKVAFINDFVSRAQFSQQYPLALSPVEFVNQLDANAGGALSANERTAAVAEFAGAATSDNTGARAKVLRRVAESQTFTQRERNPAFVLQQYFGYLQRNPDEPPDTSLEGYNFWLQKLNEFNGDYRRADMVKSFLISTEYRARFGKP